jgi:enolase
MAIPMPVVNVLARNVAGNPNVQDITITPVTASTIESSFESLLKAVNAVRTRLDEARLQYSTSSSGSFQVNTATLEEAVLVSSIIYQKLS